MFLLILCALMFIVLPNISIYLPCLFPLRSLSAGMALYGPLGTDGLGTVRKKDFDGTKQTGKGAAAGDSKPMNTLTTMDRLRASYNDISAAAVAGNKAVSILSL